MERSSEPSFTIEEVTEAFEGVVEPEAAALLLRSYAERKQAEEQEVARMQRMINIIDECDQIALLDKEGGCIITPDHILQLAINYLAPLKNSELKDKLDEKARTLSLYLLATLDGPYSYGEMVTEYLDGQPVSDKKIKSFMKRYVVEKHGAEAWLPDYDDMDFTDLFFEMNYFDGESINGVIKNQPLVDKMRKALSQQGYALKNKIGE